MPTPSNHANHVLLAIPNRKVQGLRVGDIATEVLQTLKTVSVDGFGPFVVGSGRAKDANAITLERCSRPSSGTRIRSFGKCRPSSGSCSCTGGT